MQDFFTGSKAAIFDAAWDQSLSVAGLDVGVRVGWRVLSLRQNLIFQGRWEGLHSKGNL